MLGVGPVDQKTSSAGCRLLAETVEELGFSEEFEILIQYSAPY
jgi:hypothetical protein